MILRETEKLGCSLGWVGGVFFLVVQSPVFVPNTYFAIIMSISELSGQLLHHICAKKMMNEYYYYIKDSKELFKQLKKQGLCIVYNCPAFRVLQSSCEVVKGLFAV